jgi:hypothetical protein
MSSESRSSNGLPIVVRTIFDVISVTLDCITDSVLGILVTDGVSAPLVKMRSSGRHRHWKAGVYPDSRLKQNGWEIGGSAYHFATSE